MIGRGRGIHVKQVPGGFNMFQPTSPQAGIHNTRMESHIKRRGFASKVVVVASLSQVLATKRSEGGESGLVKVEGSGKLTQIGAVEVVVDKDFEGVPEVSRKGAVEKNV